MNHLSVSSELDSKVMARLLECKAIAEKRYNMTFPLPTVHYDIRGTHAGTATHSKWLIKLNPVFLKENTADMLYETIPHEFAHLVCGKVYPEAHRNSWSSKRRPHGSEWQSIMREFGVKPSRTHAYSTVNLVTKTRSTSAQYKCINCNKHYSIGAKRIHKLTLNPASVYCVCSRRTANLVPVNTVVSKPVAVVPTIQIAKPTPFSVTKVAGGPSKMDLCANLYRVHAASKTRGQIIDMFIAVVNCTPAGASTYYSTLKKKFG